MDALHFIDDLALRFKWVAYVLLFSGLASFAWFAADREPPFAVLSVEPAAARAGEWITITAAVRRDVHRRCAASFSRYVYAADGARYDLGDSFASADVIADLERRMPGRLRVTVQLPKAMDAGPATLWTTLEYRCNKVHQWWPIEVETQMPFTVLP